MTSRSRRQTRSRRFNLPWYQWPLRHNAQVALDKAEKRILRGDHISDARGHTATTTWIVDGAFAFDITIPKTLPASPLLDTLTRRHQIAEQYRTLDTLATLGYDTRDEHDALAAEEAELWRAEL